MAYGTVQSRGVLGDPSAQARGARAEKVEGARGRKERKADRQKEEKPMRDVPLRKWKDHKNVLKDMDKELKKAKKEWVKMDKNDPERQAKIDAWRDGLQSRQETAAQFQLQRNVAQQAFEAAVEEMEGLEGSDVYAGEKGGLFNRKYSTAAEEYRQLRGGGNIELGDWKIGQDPVFNTRAQRVDYGSPALQMNPDGTPKADADGNLIPALDANGNPIVQYELGGYDEPQRGVTLDQSQYYMGTQNFKFSGRSFADVQGKTTTFKGDAADRGIQSQSEIRIDSDYQGGDRGGEEGRGFDPTMMNIGSDQQGSEEYVYGVGANYGTQGRGLFGRFRSARGGNVVDPGTTGAAARAAAGLFAKGGTTRSKRKRYDRYGNRIE